MTAVIEVLWLGMLLGVGAALSVGPIFVVIFEQAAASGFGAAFRFILGSATADLVLLLPALAFAYIIQALDRGSLWVGAVGALFLLYLAWQAAHDAVALCRSNRQLEVSHRWAFWKGVAGNLADPLSWAGLRCWPSSTQAKAAANTGSEVAAIPALLALTPRTAPTARANGSRVPTRPTPATAAATPGSARVATGHDHQGTATAQMATATRNPHSSVVAGSAPRRPASSADSR